MQATLSEMSEVMIRLWATSDVPERRFFKIYFTCPSGKKTKKDILKGKVPSKTNKQKPWKVI